MHYWGPSQGPAPHLCLRPHLDRWSGSGPWFCKFYKQKCEYVSRVAPSHHWCLWPRLDRWSWLGLWLIMFTNSFHSGVGGVDKRIYTYLSLNLRPSPRRSCTQSGASQLHGLENTAIYRTAAAARSKSPLEPARSRRGARNGRSSLLRAAFTAPQPLGARNGRSSPLRAGSRTPRKLMKKEKT